MMMQTITQTERPKAVLKGNGSWWCQEYTDSVFTVVWSPQTRLILPLLKPYSHSLKSNFKYYGKIIVWRGSKMQRPQCRMVSEVNCYINPEKLALWSTFYKPLNIHVFFMIWYNWMEVNTNRHYSQEPHDHCTLCSGPEDFWTWFWSGCMAQLSLPQN